MFMVAVQEAFTRAQAFAREVLGEKEYTLEEVERDSYKGRQVWRITPGFPKRRATAPELMRAIGAGLPLEYKTVLVDATTGEPMDEVGDLMTEFDRFDQNARAKGILIDTNLIVLLVVGSVNRDRIPLFKRTSGYTSADWDLLTGILEQIPLRYAIPHILSEVSSLIDLKGQKREIARDILHKWILLIQELPVSSLDACLSPYYQRLGLTDAALGLAAKEQGCSVMTSDSDLYVALSAEGTPVVKFDHLREQLYVD